jgi:hypothetical protein
MKRFLSVGILILLQAGLLVTGHVWAENNKPRLIFNLAKQREDLNFVKSKSGYSFEQSKPRVDRNLFEELDIVWRAEFDYPWQGQEKKTQSLFEEGLDWTWERKGERLIGKSMIASCPVGLEYFMENKQLKAKIHFINTTEKPVENLTYKFILEYPPDFSFDPQQMVLSKNGQEIEFDANLQVEGYALTRLYDGVEESALQFSLYVGNISSGEKSE